MCVRVFLSPSPSPRMWVASRGPLIARRPFMDPRIVRGSQRRRVLSRIARQRVRARHRPRGCARGLIRKRFSRFRSNAFVGIRRARRRRNVLFPYIGFKVGYESRSEIGDERNSVSLRRIGGGEGRRATRRIGRTRRYSVLSIEFVFSID